MAYTGGDATGYGDASTGYTFTPTATGYGSVVDEVLYETDRLWRFYSIPSQIHLIYTSGVSVATQQPTTTVIAAADAGSGKGDKMVYPSPGGPYPITTAESVTIISDATHGDGVGGGVG